MYHNEDEVQARIPKMCDGQREQKRCQPTEPSPETKESIPHISTSASQLKQSTLQLSSSPNIIIPEHFDLVFCGYNFFSYRNNYNLTQTTGLTFPFEQTKNISLTDRSLDVSDDRTSSGTATLGIHEFNTDLCNISGVSGASEHSVNLGKLDWLILQNKKNQKLVKCLLRLNRCIT